MTFILPALLGGLLLVGIPILLHLTMRQKPKRLPFPAFRFLLQRRRANQRSLRLRHLLLLALRISLIALMCIALARPRLFSEGLNLSTDRPRAVVMLFDTSPSMEYTVRGKTRLDEARQRAEELIAEMPSDSKVAILDSSEIGGEWSANVDAARKRVDGLKLRAANAPVTRQLDQAYRLLKDLQEESDDNKEPMPRFVYVFSDRTNSSWETSVADTLHQPDDVNAVFVDVGVDPENVGDVAILKVEPDLQIVPAGNAVQIKVTIRSIGIDGENQLVCLFDNEAKGETKPIQLKAGDSSIAVFERPTEEEGESGPGLRPGWHQVTVRLGTTDALPSNNVGFATFKVQERRRVLVIADHEEDAEAWQDYINRFKGSGGFQAFHCDVLKTEDSGNALTTAGANYVAICLLDVADPSSEMWDKLNRFVKAGGGLTIVPGGWKWKVNQDQYNADANAKELMPGKLDGEVVEKDKKKAWWRELRPNQTSKHKLLDPFMRWKKNENILFFQEEAFPWALHSWKVSPHEDNVEVIASYGDDRPALLERTVGEGHVLLFTTALDQRLHNNQYANNYLENGDQSFFSVLVNVTMNYLAGGAKEANFNRLCGETITVDLGAPPFLPIYELEGPGLEGVGTLARAEDQAKLTINQASSPGNFRVFASAEKNNDRLRVVSCFSLSTRPDEWDLNQTTVETIEKLLGPGSVVPVKQGSNLIQSLQGHWRQPLELFPYLMILLLLALAFENLLSNKFYKREPVPEEQA
jgi:hypothetical protein